MFSIPVRSMFGFGRKTQTAGTVITQVCPGKRGCFTYVTFMRYTNAATDHLLTLMRSASNGLVTTAVAAAGTAVIVDTALTDGGTNAIAANDYISIEMDDGTFHTDIVSAWNSSTKTITLTTAVPTGRSILAGAKVWCYGVPGDSYHAAYQFDPITANASANFPAVANYGPLIKSRTKGEPIIFYSGNATNAGTLESLSGINSPVG